MFTKEELQSLDREALVDIVLQQQRDLDSTAEQLQIPSDELSPHSSVVHSPASEPSIHPSPALNLASAPNFNTSKPTTSKPIVLVLALLGAVALHGLVLLIPIASQPEEEATEEDLSTELVIPMTQLPPRSPEPSPQPSVTPSPVAPEPPPPAQPPQPEPPVVVVQPPPLEPSPQPPAPEPQPTEAEPQTPPQEPEPQPETQPEQAEPEEEIPPTPSDIAGVPLEAAWQVLEQPIAQGVNDAQWYANPEGQIRQDIRGLVEIPEADFEEFFAAYRQQLTAAGFTIRAEGAYRGTPIYRLTSQTSETPLFITLEPLEEGSILMAIWEKYPW
jgi:hypothetical protein